MGSEVRARLGPEPQTHGSEPPVWYLDEVVLTIAGQTHWLWRVEDLDGYVLDEIVQTRRDTKAAKRLLKRLLKKQGCPSR